jgi:CheY-like chemotaxis protein
MTLESMIVSRDWQEVSVLECVLGGLQIGVQVESDANRARSLFQRSKIDALIVDCDLSGTEQFVSKMRAARNNGGVPLVLMSRSPERHDLPLSGANFYFEKPISVEQAVRTLSAARNLILNGRLRYHREPVNMPVFISFAGQKEMSVHLMNLSQGGIGICAPRPLDGRGPVNITFQLPDTKTSLDAKGEFAWTDHTGNAGIRFVEVPEMLQRNLQLWLEQRYFAH